MAWHISYEKHSVAWLLSIQAVCLKCTTSHICQFSITTPCLDGGKKCLTFTHWRRKIKDVKSLFAISDALIGYGHKLESKIAIGCLQSPPMLRDGFDKSLTVQPRWTLASLSFPAPLVANHPQCARELPSKFSPDFGPDCKWKSDAVAHLASVLSITSGLTTSGMTFVVSCLN